MRIWASAASWKFFNRFPAILFFRISLLVSCLLIMITLTLMPSMVMAQEANQKLKLLPLPIELASKDPSVSVVDISDDGYKIAVLRNASVNGNTTNLVEVRSSTDINQVLSSISLARGKIVNVAFVKNNVLKLDVRGERTYNNAFLINGFNWMLFWEIGSKEEPTYHMASRIIKNENPDDNNVFLVSGDTVSRLDVRKKAATPVKIAQLPLGQTVISIDSVNTINLKQTTILEKGVYKKHLFHRSNGNDWVEQNDLAVNMEAKAFERDIIAVSAENDKMWLSTESTENNFRTIHEWDFGNKKLGPALFKNTEYDIANLVFWSAEDGGKAAKLTRNISGFCFYGPTYECAYTNPVLSQIQNRFVDRFGDAEVRILKAVHGGELVLLEVSAPDRPRAWFLMKQKLDLVRIASLFEEPQGFRFGRGFWAEFISRDGLKLNGVVTLPPDYDPKKDGRLPLVVLPRSKPSSRNFYVYDDSHFPQLFATRGFAVFQPNFRGSRSLGRQIRLSGEQEWGNKMQDDLEDAAKFMVEAGVVDPDRVMIFGHSYGGYAAAVAATKSTGISKGIWQCAISLAPVIDLRMVNNIDSSYDSLNWYNYRFEYSGWNPAENLDKVEIPWLIMQPANDEFIGVRQSLSVSSSIRRLGNNKFKFIEIPNASHYASDSSADARRLMYSNILDFTANNCGNIAKTFDDDEASSIVRAALVK